MGKKIREGQHECSDPGCTLCFYHRPNRRIISPRKEAEEMQEKFFSEHPAFYKQHHFCPIHAWDSCKKNHSEDVLLRAQVAGYRAKILKDIEVKILAESESDPDEDFEAHMAAIEAEEAQTAKDWASWFDDLTPEPTTAKIGIKPGKLFRSCQHHLQPFTFKVGKQEYTLFGSAFNNRKSKAQAEKANLCVFLDTHWMDAYSNPIWMNPAMSSKLSFGPSTIQETPTIVLDWPDMGVLSIEDLKPVVNHLALALQIDQRIEIGCIGGHGRTGTMMALIMVQLGCKPGNAIKTIRKDYCDSAIETKKQEDLIKAFAEEVQG